MFYISRRIGTSRFVVVDTDDGHEDIMTYSGLEHAVCKLGIEITGVQIKMWNGTLKIDRIEPYTPKSSVTKAQAKLATLSGIDIKVNNGQIVSFKWRNPPNSLPRVIRLSDYGSSCGGCIFERAVVAYSNGVVNESPLTIVLDDKVTFDHKTFRGASNIPIIFDLSEVKNEKAATIFYKDFITSYISDSHLRDFVIDIDARKDYWTAYKVINYGIAYDPGGNEIGFYVDDAEKVTEQMLEKYGKEFLALQHTYDFELKAESDRKYVGIQYLEYIMHEHPNLMVTNNFDDVWNVFRRNYGSVSLYHVLEYETVASCPASLKRFIHFISYFSVSEELQKAFVAFYHKANALLIEKARKVGWIK